MFTNYIKVSARIFLRHKLYTFINVFGLSLGIACSILIMLFVRDELTFDSFHRASDRLYRVVTDSRTTRGESNITAYQPLPLAPALKAEFPEVIRAARFSTGGAIISRGDKIFAETVLYTDPDAFSMFDIQFVSGDRSRAFQEPNDIILTESMANTFFGSENPIGQRLGVQSRKGFEEFVVAGVVKQMPSNSSLQFDFLANIRKHPNYSALKDLWTFSNGSAFIQLAVGSSLADVQKKLPGFVTEHYAAETKGDVEVNGLNKEGNAIRIELQPLRSVHLDTRIQSSPEEQGNPAYAYILSGIALFVLAIASINFTTLAISRSVNRSKEVGMRKVLGAGRSQLMRQFLGEALLLTFVALLLGVVLAELGLPAFNHLTGKHLSMDVFSDGFLIAALAGLLVLVGCLAGSYPAFYLSRYEPVETLKGRLRTTGRGFLIDALVVFQFGLSIFLITGSVVLAQQLNLLLTKDLGYNDANVVVLTSYTGDRYQEAAALVDRFRNKVKENPVIVSVSGTSGAFTHGEDNGTFEYRGEKKSTYMYRVDEEYVGTLGLQFKEGRNFFSGNTHKEQNGILVNEAFLREMGWSEPAVGNKIETTGNNLFAGKEVIGVLKDFHFQSLREQIQPVVLFENANWPLDNILVRIEPTNVRATMAYLEKVWKDVAPGKPFDASFLNDDVQHQYESEMKWGMIIEFSSFLAIALACLGLFGLASFSIANRTKEIGIRKLLGASIGELLGHVSKEFVRLVLVANVIAWPAAYFALSKFLDDYASRIQLNAGIFLVAGGLVLAIALLTISVQVVRAALANPVDALRYE